MSTKLNVAFDDPADGWIELKLRSGNAVINIVASYTPYDSFLDLINTLYNLSLYEAESKVIWNEEPVEYEMHFGRVGNVVSLDVVEFPSHIRDLQQAATRFKASGTFEEVALPFWRALRDLQGRLSVEELRARWHRDFPVQEMEGLTSILRKAS